MPILLKDIWPVENPLDYKIHFARWNSDEQPLETFVRDRSEWQGWQEFKSSNRSEFNRPFIFSLASFYHEPNCWLFGGIFKVIALHKDSYEVQLVDELAGFIGRLKLLSPYTSRSTRVKFEKQYNDFKVQEILREPYSGRQFPGYDSIDISFQELETLVKNSRIDWMTALGNAKGIYVISDSNTKKLYIGAAYSEQGIWSRWCDYVRSGHGGNVELNSIVTASSLDYCRKHFRFSLIELLLPQTPDTVILKREAYWKQILLTRGESGMNRN